jgi:RHS repeat-associated protein
MTRRFFLAVVVLALAIAGATRWPAPGVAGSPLSDASDDPALMRDIARQNAERAAAEARRKSPEERAARAESRTKYQDLDAPRAKELATRTFEPQLLSPPLGRLREGEHITGYLNDHTAEIQTDKGRKLALVSSLPLVTRDSDGKRKPVDLTLRPDSRGFTPANALAPFRIGARASDGVRFDAAGLTMTFDGAPDSEGEALSDSDVIYHEVAQDTDLIASAVVFGEETSFQLRSERSPDQLALNVDLDEGSRLESAIDKTTGGMGARVVHGGTALAGVSAPVAVDADGVPVPASMRVEGQRLVITVDHRGGDFKYPILVDPTVIEYVEDFNWHDNGAIGQGRWAYAVSNQADLGRWTFLLSSNATWGRGLEIGVQGGDWGDGSWGEWHWDAPGTAYVRRAEFLYVYSANAGITSTCQRAYLWQVYGGVADLQQVCNRDINNGYFNITDTVPHPGNRAVMNLWFNGTMYRNNLTYYGVGWAKLYVDDNDDPSVGASDGFSGTWRSDGLSGSANVSGSDGGVGVRWLSFNRPNAGTATADRGCSGYDYAGSACSGSWSSSFSYSTSNLNEGANTLSAYAKDALGHTSPTTSWTVYVDKTAPAIAGYGSAAVQPNAELKSGSYTLHVDGQDPNPAVSTALNSGIKSFSYSVGSGNTLQTLTRTCGSGACSGDLTVNATSSGLAEGRNTIKPKATDGVGKSVSSQFDVIVDRGAPIIFGRSGAISAADAIVAPGTTYPLTVNACDGSSSTYSPCAVGERSGVARVEAWLGTTLKDTAVRSPAASGDWSPTLNIAVNSADGTGQKTMKLLAYDEAGNVSAAVTWPVIVDTKGPVITLSGSLADNFGRVLFLNQYELKYTVTDGNATSDQQSGARRLWLYVKAAGSDDSTYQQIEDSGDHPCATSGRSCSFSNDNNPLTFALAAYQPGKYVLKAEAVDWAGLRSTLYEPIYIGQGLGNSLPALDSRLGFERWWHYEDVPAGAGTDASVNLATGNLLWQVQPIDEAGTGIDSVATLTYNSQESSLDAQLPQDVVGDALGQYDQVGRGFSLSLSGITRLNEPLDVSAAALGTIKLTDADGTQHVFGAPAGGQDSGQIFQAPKGVHLYLRRFSADGLSGLQDPSKVYAATRPDGTTYFFDSFGYLTSVQDRSHNHLDYVYEFRSLTGGTCSAAAAVSNRRPDVFAIDDSICPRRVTRVLDPSCNGVESCTRDLEITYYPDSGIEDLNLPQSQWNKASGPVKTITDHRGRALQFTYDADGYLTQLTEAVGATNALGDSDQRSWGFAYEQLTGAMALIKQRALTGITDPNGKTTTFAHKTDSDQVGPGAIADGVLTRHRVDYAVDRGEQGTTTRSRSFGYSVDPVSNEPDANVTDSRAKTWQHVMDPAGRVTSVVDPLGTKTQISWDQKPDGTAASNLVNGLTQVIRAAGTADGATTSLSYNALGQVVTSTDPNGHTTRLTYRTSAGPAELRSSRLASDGQSLDARSRGFVSDLGEIETPRGVETQTADDFATIYSYTEDAQSADYDRGNVVSVRDGAGGVRQFAYDPATGNVTQETDEVQNVTKYQEYDATGQPKTVIDPRNKTWRYTYDSAGDPLTIADPRADGTCAGNAYTTRVDYDAFDRVVRMVVPKDSSQCIDVTRTEKFDSNGNVRSQTDGNGQTTDWTYTAMDMPATRLSPSAPHADGAAREETRFGYDTEDNLTSQISPRGVQAGADGSAYATEYKVDDIGRRVEQTRHSSTDTDRTLITSYAYNRRDLIVGIADPTANKLYPVDPIANASDTSKLRLQYAYDAAGNRTDRIELPGPAPRLNLHTHWSYDSNDNLVVETSPRGYDQGADAQAYTTRRTYDGGDRLTDVTDPLGRRTRYTLRADGKLSAEISARGTKGWGDNSPYFRASYDYWPTGETKSITMPVAPNEYLAAPVFQYQINAVGDPETVTDGRGNSFQNRFFDTGELKWTDRPSWWRFPLDEGGATSSLDALTSGDAFEAPDAAGALDDAADGEVTMLSPQELTARNASPQVPDLPQAETEGDFGAVDSEDPPSFLPRAGRTTFSYDGEMRLTQITDVAGKETTIGHDPLGRITETKQPIDQGAGRWVIDRYAYDRNGNLRSATRANGWRIDDNGNTGDLTTTYDWDKYDRPLKITVPGQTATDTEETVLAWDANGNLDSRQTPRGAGFSWAYDYDPADRLISSTNPETEAERYGYDSDGNRTSRKTPLGKLWKSTFDAAGQLTQVTSPLDGQTKPTGAAVANDGVTTFSYDDDGNQIRIEAPGAMRYGGSYERQAIDTTYDGRGLPWAATTGAGTYARTTITEFDGNGNLRRQIDPLGVTTASDGTKVPRNNWAGDPSSADAVNATVYEYQADDLRTTTWLPYSTSTTSSLGNPCRWKMDFGYDARGRIDTLVAPHMWQTQANCPPANTAAVENATTTYTHYDSGWISSQTEPAYTDTSGVLKEQTLVYDYDARGNQVSWKSPQGSTERRILSRYINPDGTLAKRVARDSTGSTPTTYTYGYNKNRSLVHINDDRPGSTPWDVTITYDGAERPALVDDQTASGDTSYTYDDDSRVTKLHVGGDYANGKFTKGKTTAFGYDDAGRETDAWTCIDGFDGCGASSYYRKTHTIYWPSGDVYRQEKPNGTWEYFYFTNDGLRNVDDRWNGSNNRRTTYTYNTNGDRTADEHGTYTFNVRDQLVHWTPGGDEPAGTADVDYDPNGDGSIHKITDGQGTRVYRYSASRLSEVADATTGQPLVKYAYDSTGFGEIKEIQPTTAAHTFFTYDAFGRLKTSQAPSDPATTSFRYDGLDRRDRRITNSTGLAGIPQVRTDYTYIGLTDALAREVDSGTGTRLTVPVRTYDYDSRGQRLGQQAGSSETKGTYRPFTYDAGGSVIGLEDSSGLYGTGNADQYHFDPYGTGTIGGLGSTTDAVAGSNASYNPFRFQGFYADSDVSTYDMVARAYRPDVQQFLSQDRFQSATGDLTLQQNPLTSSRYAFAYANPVDNIESDGHEPYHGSFNDCYKGSHFCAPRKKPTRKQQVRAQQVRTVERQQAQSTHQYLTRRAAETKSQMDFENRMERRQNPLSPSALFGAFVKEAIGDPLHNPLDAAALIPAGKLTKLSKLPKAVKALEEADRGLKDLPKLTGTIAESFEGAHYTARTFKAGTTFYRAEARNAKAPGRFLGTEAADTQREAEAAYNIAKWGNPAHVMRRYELTQDVTLYYGKVAGGEGYQALIPRGIDPESVLRLRGMRPVR